MSLFRFGGTPTDKGNPPLTRYISFYPDGYGEVTNQGDSTFYCFCATKPFKIYKKYTIFSGLLFIFNGILLYAPH